MAPDDDVRFRLSAEGVAEVVAALQKIRAESVATGKVATNSMVGLNTALSTVRRTLGGLGLALSVGTFSALTTGAADAAERILNLSQALGASVQSTQAVSAAAKRSGTDLRSIAGSVGQFARLTNEALRGDPQALGLFRAIGLTRGEIEKFKGLDTIQRLELTAGAFSKLRDGSAKTELAIALFGKRFTDLLPLVNELGANGLPRLAIALREDTLKAAAAVGDELDDLKIQSQALAIQFVAGMAPAMTAALRGIAAETASGASSWERMGKIVGAVLAGILSAIVLTADGVVTLVSTMARVVGDLAQAVHKAATGDVLGARGDIARAVDTWKVEMKKLEERGAKIGDSLFRRPGPLVGPPVPPGFNFAGESDVGDLAEVGQRRADLRRAQIDRELKLIQAGLKLQEREEQRAHEMGLTSLRELYDRRRAIVVQGVNAEIVALQKRRVIAEADPGLKNRAAEIAKIDGEIEQLVIGRAAMLEDLNAKEAEEARDLARQRLELDRTIFEAQGDHQAAALLQMQKAIDDADLLLARSGATAEEAERTLAALRSSLSAQQTFNDLSRDASAGMRALEDERSKIQDEINAGLRSQAVGEAQILAMERDRVVALGQIARAMLVVAEESGSPERIAQAQDFLRNVEQLEIGLRRVEDVGAGVRAVMVDTIGGSLVQTFGEGEVAAIKFGSVLKSVLLDVTAALRRFLTQLLFTRAIMAIFGGGSKIPAISGATDAGAASFRTAAAGGLITGPGTGTSDSIPAMLSHGEYVVRAAAVSRPGVLAALEALNRGPMYLNPPRMDYRANFASGGLVSAAGRGGSVSASLRIGLAPGLIADFIRSPEGRQVLLEVVEENPRAFRSILGS